MWKYLRNFNFLPGRTISGKAVIVRFVCKQVNGAHLLVSITFIKVVRLGQNISRQMMKGAATDVFGIIQMSGDKA